MHYKQSKREQIGTRPVTPLAEVEACTPDKGTKDSPSLLQRLTKKRVELVPWSIGDTRGPSMILLEDAAMVPFIGEEGQQSSGTV